MTDMEGLKRRISEETEGRGADVVLEVVGNSKALRMGFDILRPWGVISSVGVHNAEVRGDQFELISTAWLMTPQVPFTAAEAYNKNVRVQFGRCPVRAVFPKALELLQQKEHLLG